MEPCTSPTYSSLAEFPARDHAADREPETFPALLPLLVGVAAFVWVRQRWGGRLVLLHLARPEPPQKRRPFRCPRLVLSDRERRALAAVRALFGRRPGAAAVPARAAAPVRATRR